MDDVNIFDSLGKPKVGDFKVPILDKDILRFNIAMNDCSLVQDFIAFAELLEEKPYFLFGKVVSIVEDILLQVSLVAIFHDNVEIVFA